jgi:hypothetical protein
LFAIRGELGGLEAGYKGWIRPRSDLILAPELAPALFSALSRSPKRGNPLDKRVSLL